MSLVLSTAFQKEMLKLATKNPQLKKQLAKTLKLLAASPTHPSLRLHKLSHRRDFSVSVNMSIRIIFRFVGADVYLLSIGTHDQVY